MAQTDFSALSDARRAVWSTRIWQAGRDGSTIMSSGMMGTEPTRPVYQVTELSKDQKGDRCIMQLVQDLVGDGVAGDRKLTGKEEQAENEAQTIKIDQLRNGMVNKGRMSDQATVLRFRMIAKDKLGFWLGDRLDQLAFLTASGISYTLKLTGAPRPDLAFSQLTFAADVTAPTSNRKYFCGGSAVSTATLAATDKITWNDIVTVRAKAEESLMKPIRMNGKDYYILILSPRQSRDLRLDDDYKSIVANAGNRGEANPLFKGMMADVDGVLIYTSKKVANTTGLASGAKYGAAGTVEGAQALMLGAQAIGLATIGQPEWAEGEITDYGNQQGVAYGQLFGFKKPVFKSQADGGTSEDFGAMQVYSAAA